MKISMFWFDNSPMENIKTKAIEAADYYRKKYGQVPTICMANPQMLGPDVRMGDEMKISRVAVRVMRTITTGHLWIGLEEDDRYDKART